MGAEIVTARIGGEPFRGWKRVSIRAALDEACRSFSLTVAAEDGAAAAAAKFQIFTPIQLLAGGDLVFDGYLDRRRPHRDPENSYIVLSGRSRGQDAVDCSCLHPTGEFTGKTALEIAKGLDQFGVGFSCDRALSPIDFQVTPGESVFRAVERLCRDEGLTPCGQADGSIKLMDASSAPKHAGGLFAGVNIKSGEADHNASNRHSHVHARGQSYEGHGADALHLEATAADTSVPRYRPHVLVHDGETSKARLKTRAASRRDRAAGNGLSASITTVGWRDEAGLLWTPGNLVWTEDDLLDVRQDMLVRCLSLDQEAEAPEGTLARLDLVDPRAFGGKKGRGAKSGASWNFDDSDAE